ncbi:MAG: EAL domain-containing protein [Proteobacteria bacterium]|nr:MAG: EAL domain-containing protein [Pseudomonadota bacterium]
MTALADREAKLRILVEAIPESLWVVSADGELRWTPGRVRDEDTGSMEASGFVHNVIPGPQVAEVHAAIRSTAADGRSRRLEYQDDRQLAAHVSCELRFTRCDGGDVLVVRQDTSERTLAAARIERLAYYDPLTGLANRQRFMDLSESSIAGARSAGERLAVIYLDLNSFKRINDSFGHSVGDEVLKVVAERLARKAEGLRREWPEVSLARLGGDEFAMLVRASEGYEAAAVAAEAFRTCLAEPVAWNQIEFLTAPSIGVALFPQDGSDIETLLKNADAAMYHAKARGLAEVVFYDEGLSARSRDWYELEARLRRAIREDLLELHYQPKFRLHDRSVAGVEALVRWFDDKHGQVSPRRFVDIAEESGLVLDLGQWLVRAVCRQLRTWLDAGIAVPIAINISGKDLAYGDPAGLIEAETTRLGVPPSLIEVEITETVFVNDSSAGRRAVDRLRALGCRIALDDFGTGFSSLAYLSRFPPHRLKIDRSFIANVDRSTSDGAIVNAMMSLARSLQLVVTAEGVERREQLDWLVACGCHEVQGFLLARPLAAPELEARFLRTPDDATLLRMGEDEDSATQPGMDPPRCEARALSAS